VYASFRSQGNTNGPHIYSYDEGTPTSVVRSHGTNAAGDLVLDWTDSGSTTRNVNFERMFAGPITVAGGDGFELKLTAVTNFAWSDTAVIDYVPSPILLMDNEEPGFSINVADATPFSAISTREDAYQDSQRWFRGEGGTAWAKYNFSAVPNGVYDVYASWRDNGANNLDTQTTYTMTDGGGAAIVNQRINPTADLVLTDPLDGDWIDLQLLAATVAITDGDFEVTITAPNDDPGGTRLFAFADVVALVPIPEPSTFALSALGLLGLLAWNRRRRP